MQTTRDSSGICHLVTADRIARLVSIRFFVHSYFAVRTRWTNRYLQICFRLFAFDGHHRVQDDNERCVYEIAWNAHDSIIFAECDRPEIKVKLFVQGQFLRRNRTKRPKRLPAIDCFETFEIGFREPMCMYYKQTIWCSMCCSSFGSSFTSNTSFLSNEEYAALAQWYLDAPVRFHSKMIFDAIANPKKSDEVNAGYDSSRSCLWRTACIHSLRLIHTVCDVILFLHLDYRVGSAILRFTTCDNRPTIERFNINICRWWHLHHIYHAQRERTRSRFAILEWINDAAATSRPNISNTNQLNMHDIFGTSIRWFASLCLCVCASACAQCSSWTSGHSKCELNWKSQVKNG